LNKKQIKMMNMNRPVLKRYRKKEGTRQRGVELGIICQIRE
jgi:hypothetical protein